MNEIETRGYAHPDFLVSTEWVEAHLNDPNLRIIESNEDTLTFRAGHIPGATEVDWVNDLNHQRIRDYIDRSAFESLMSKLGITASTTIVLYGDRFNWWATYTFWVFSLYGHKNLKIMDGGKMKWEKEGRALTKETKSYPPATYQAAGDFTTEIRAFREDVFKHLANNAPLIDVRSPEEYAGTRLHMPDYPNEGALRGGHIPGARNIPWAKAVDPETGSFRSYKELIDLYENIAKLRSQDNVIAYCRIGERSSHTWFVLRHLLGFRNVRNYDGSWTEWGNLVGAPIEK
jgi:thiosulfate/3-mercaptopyruvate sulfurtransferase